MIRAGRPRDDTAPLKEGPNYLMIGQPERRSAVVLQRLRILDGQTYRYAYLRTRYVQNSCVDRADGRNFFVRAGSHP
jgi:hypothetical protein